MKALAVGGPVDGRWIEAVHHDFPSFEDRQPYRSLTKLLDEYPAPPDCVRYTRYQPVKVAFGDTYVEIFAPMDWAPDRVLNRLISGYRVIKTEDR